MKVKQIISTSKLLQEAGFKVASIEIKRGFTELMSMNAYYIFKNVFRTRKYGSNLFKTKRNKGYLDKDRKGFATLFIVTEKMRKPRK